MKCIPLNVATLLAVVIVVSGCKKHEQCAPGDTPAVCKAVQDCFASGTAADVCREGEKDAMQPRKDLPTATSGDADALKYDSSKPSQKPTPPQPKK